MSNFSVTPEERVYLRELAKKCQEYASLPVMAERRKLWYEHNSLQGRRPLLVMELQTFIKDILPPLKCASPVAREIEAELQTRIVNHELVDDDKVLPDDYTVPWQIDFRLFDLEVKMHRAEDSEGRNVGYQFEYDITDLRRDIEKLRPSTFRADRSATFAKKEFVESLIGDILPVNIKNMSMAWAFGITARVVMLMGMENMFMSLMDSPEEMVRLFNMIRDGMLDFSRWMEREELLTLNNGNDYAGAGSYGFTSELPSADFSGKVRCKDLWANLNSQESVGLSPEMFRDYIYPSYRDLAKEFGMTYYGCCEPVHEIWESCIRHLPNLRKVSVSAWCNQQSIGDALRGSKVIYSRKPSPNYIGVGDFVPEAYAAHIAETLNAARGCELEIIHRDIYTLNGDRTRPGRAIKIARELIEKQWHCQ
ncbi:MAG: hypothetical protein WCV67_06075 [Victivallaceae bacterium]